MGSDFALLELDVIRVKGKAEPEVIYALLGTKELAAEPHFIELRDRVCQMIAAYRKQNWSEALTALRSCRQNANGLDLATFCDFYEARIGEFKIDPPPPGWDGIATLQTK